MTAVRLHKLKSEYADRLVYNWKVLALEVFNRKETPKEILDQEWWLAAIQEPAAAFAPYQGDDWPTTTLPAFEAAWCAARQGEEALATFDLGVRRAFFAQGRNIGRWAVLREIAEEVGLDRERFEQDFNRGEARSAVLEEARLGRERYRVRGTPTLMLADGTKVRHPIAYPRMEDRKVVEVPALPCCGEDCLEATRAVIEQALPASPAAD